MFMLLFYIYSPPSQLYVDASLLQSSPPGRLYVDATFLHIFTIRSTLCWCYCYSSTYLHHQVGFTMISIF